MKDTLNKFLDNGNLLFGTLVEVILITGVEFYKIAISIVGLEPKRSIHDLIFGIEYFTL